MASRRDRDFGRLRAHGAVPSIRASRRRMILVTGMQRSGTSMVCQLLAACGASFGDDADLLPADRWNASGYFEAKAVMDVNSRIITGFARHGSPFEAWLAKVAYLRMPRRSRIEARAPRHRETVAALGRKYEPCVVKDPRFCLTLQHWRNWTDVSRIVVCMRNPAAVVESLLRRHGIPRWYGARFYAWHIDSLVAQLPAQSVSYVDVDRLVAGDAGEFDALRRGLGLPLDPPAASLLRRIVRPEVFASPGAGAALPAIAEQSWRRLQDAAARASTSIVPAR